MLLVLALMKGPSRARLLLTLLAVLFVVIKLRRAAALAWFPLVMTAVLPTFALAGPGGDEAAGAAAPAVRQWFTRDLSLECSDPNGVTVHCGAANTPAIRIQYGNAGGGSGSPDAIAFVQYLNDPTGNAEQLAVAVFRQTGGNYQFVKRLPPATVGNLASGAAVRFQNGQASWAAEALRAGDSRSMATGRRQVTVSIR